MGSVLNIGGGYFHMPASFFDPSSDMRAVAFDWGMIGSDITSVISQQVNALLNSSKPL
jgi:hypothetical protein